MIALTDSIDNERFRTAGRRLKEQGQLLRQRGCHMVAVGAEAAGEALCADGDKMITNGQFLIGQARKVPNMDKLTPAERSIAIAYKLGYLLRAEGEAEIPEGVHMRGRGLEIEERGVEMRRRGCQLTLEADEPHWVRGKLCGHDAAKASEGYRLRAVGNKLITEGKQVYKAGVKLEKDAKAKLRESKRQFRLAGEARQEERQTTGAAHPALLTD